MRVDQVPRVSTDALRGLADLARDRTAREGLEAQLVVARQRLEDTEQRAAAAVDALAGELADVDRLESMSMTRILAGLRGRRDTDLDRERSEAQAAQYAARRGGGPPGRGRSRGHRPGGPHQRPR